MSEATRDIWYSEWDDEEINARLDLTGAPPVLRINGTGPYETLEHRWERLRGR